MTQEEKQILLKDLCARLSYGVFIHTWYDKPLDIKCTGIDLYTNAINLDIPDDDNAKVYIDNCKPYLRPMSSMTEEERNEYFDFRNQELQRVAFAEVGREAAIAEISDWLNAHHFDYSGLIEKGLALEAPADMYNLKPI